MLLSLWFFVTITTLWLLKPIRVASLLAHLGAAETPYVRLAGVVVVGVVVFVYSAVVNRVQRVTLIRASGLLFASVLVAFALALHFEGHALGALRPFVWAVYILVEIYSVVMVGIFWTYTNDVVSEHESNRLYGLIGLGGIGGGIAGGAFVDAFARSLGPTRMLVACAALVLAAVVLGSVTEWVCKPPPRRRDAGPEQTAATTFGDALQGVREIASSRYLLLLVGIVVAYEFTATLTDFGISVIFERAYADEGQLAKMYGRLGWISSGVAVLCQVFVVPFVLPRKQIGLALPPAALLAGALLTALLPVAAAAMVLGAADRGLNYSIQQATKESLYVPLSDVQRFKAKAVIDMFVDRAAKAGAAFVLIALIARWGVTARPALASALLSVGLWLLAARRLGKQPAPAVGSIDRRPKDAAEPADACVAPRPLDQGGGRGGSTSS